MGTRGHEGSKFILMSNSDYGLSSVALTMGISKDHLG
jgi:hypothetical protein